MLPAGRISDMHGHRRCFLGAWAWLAISSLVAGISFYSHSFVFYSVCRGLQGMATAMMIPCALAILGSTYKEGRRKNLAFSVYAAGSPLGFTLGGVFSGILVRFLWWPWIFWTTSIACCAILSVAYFVIPEIPGHLRRQTRSPQSEIVHSAKFDWLGAITGVAGLILFNVSWNLAPAIGWDAPVSVVLLILGLLLLAAFPVIEKRVAEPLIPVDCISTECLFVLAIMGLAWASFGVLTFYLINFLLHLRGDTILSVAAQFAPVPLAGFVASYLNSFLLGKGARPADVLGFSTLWFVAGNILLATLPVRQVFWEQVFWINILAPLGIDLSFPSATLMISQLVPPERQGVAASLVATIVYYSQSIGLGIAGTVEKYVSDGNLLAGYRGASYTGTGLSALSFVVSMWPVWQLHMAKSPNKGFS